MFYSIVIPVFNKSNNVKTTIESVLNQSFRDFELIIVNDGSTDNSLTIIQSFNDERIRIINKPNGGVSSARNAGIYAAKCKYIAFLDADDNWDPAYLGAMKKLVDDFPEASFFGCQHVFKNGIETKIVNKCHTNRGMIDNYFKEAIKAPLVNSSAVIIEKKCFEKIGCFNTSYTRGEDLDLWSRLARNFYMAFEPIPMIYYNQDASNRACNRIFPLSSYYLETNLCKLPSHEKIYFNQLAKGVFKEMLKNKNIGNLIHLALNYKFYSIRLLIEIFNENRKQ